MAVIPGRQDGIDGASSKLAAQRRTDRIAAFREELQELEREGVLVLPPEERARVAAHHEELLRGLASRFDVDLGERERQLSWGMRIASFLGAVALAASAFFFLYRIWGLLATPVQVAILAGGPVLLLAATDFAARRERSGYFAALIGLVTFTAFFLNVFMLGEIFNVTPSPGALLAYGLFGIVLAYAFGGRLILILALAALASWQASWMITWTGAVWTELFERPETFLPAGLLLFAVPFAVPHRARLELVPVWRAVGLIVFLSAVLNLTYSGENSFLRDLGDERVEIAYQILGFLVSAAAIWLGIRLGWRESVSTGGVFFVIFLLARFFDWWWDWMPRYLFFLVIGSTAVLALWALMRLRAAAASSAAAASRPVGET